VQNKTYIMNYKKLSRKNLLNCNKLQIQNTVGCCDDNIFLTWQIRQYTNQMTSMDSSVNLTSVQRILTKGCIAWEGGLFHG